MTYRQVAELDQALDIQEDVISDINSFKSVLDPEILADDTVMETLERVALNERLSGADKETVRKKLTEKSDKWADYNRRMSVTGINEKL